MMDCCVNSQLKFTAGGMLRQAAAEGTKGAGASDATAKKNSTHF